MSSFCLNNGFRLQKAIRATMQTLETTSEKAVSSRVTWQNTPRFMEYFSSLGQGFLRPHILKEEKALGTRLVQHEIKLHSALSFVNWNHRSRAYRKFRLHSSLSLVNSNHQSPVCQHDNRQSTDRVHAKSIAHGKIADCRMFLELSQTRITVRSPWRLNRMSKLWGFMDMVFLWRFSAMLCDTRRSVGLARLKSPTFLRF